MSNVKKSQIMEASNTKAFIVDSYKWVSSDMYLNKFILWSSEG